MSAFLVHGLGKEPAEPDWPPLTDDEVSRVLQSYDRAAGDAVVTWRSPRPMSAAALVSWRGDTVFVKRHDRRVRSVARLDVEHAFAAHLRERGEALPPLLRTPTGATVVSSEQWVYDVQRAADGLDLYRDRPSWTPFASLGHARTAGAALARFHRAARGFAAARASVAVLTSSDAVITASAPLDEIDRLLAARPGLARFLGGRAWREELGPHVGWVQRAAPFVARLEPQWGHGDWHPSNLAWTAPGPGAAIVDVLDLGLANRTSALHDLAVAIDRCTLDWLELPDTVADLDAVDALLDGYESVRPLTGDETKALPELLPVIHLEHALSEIEYFAEVVRSDERADVAYTGYLLGHTAWFQSESGQTLLEHLRRRR